MTRLDGGKIIIPSRRPSGGPQAQRRDKVEDESPPSVSSTVSLAAVSSQHAELFATTRRRRRCALMVVHTALLRRQAHGIGVPRLTARGLHRFFPPTIAAERGASGASDETRRRTLPISLRRFHRATVSPQPSPCRFSTHAASPHHRPLRHPPLHPGRSAPPTAAPSLTASHGREQIDTEKRGMREERREGRG